MTTIVTDGRSMAADRLVTDGGIAHGQICKLRRTSDGTIIGATGSVYYLDKFVRFYDSGMEFDIGTDDFEAMVLKSDGSVWCYDRRGDRYEAGSPSAIGSGSAVAYGAVGAGASPEQAALIACRYDIHSGGGVDVMHLT